MIRILLGGCVAIASAGLTGCVSTSPVAYEPHALTREQANRVENDVRRRLRNPDALFAGLKAARSTDGPFVVCGWVRQKSDIHEYAKYPANRPFVATYSGGPDKLRGFRLTHFADVKEEAASLYTHCAQRGIPL